MKRGAIALALAACGCGDEATAFNGCDFETPSAGDCSFAAQQSYVEGVMRAHYLFADQLADVDPGQFEELGAFIRALTADVEPADRFTFVTTVQQEQDSFIEGKSTGFGFRLASDGESLRVQEVFGIEAGEPPSPASSGGLRRGDVILAIDGETVEKLRAEDRLSDALFRHELGDVVAFDIDTGRQNRRVELEWSSFEVAPVPLVEVFDEEEGGLSIGYVLIRSFIQPTEAGLLQAFARLRLVDALVVDLRYNGGGLLSVARSLAELAVGMENVGRTFYEARFNQRNQSCNSVVPFGLANLGVARPIPIAVIGTGGTASASELFVNGLRPHTRVELVGSRTFGKPVGQLGFSFCERVLRPTTFQLLNAEGEGDYFEGLAPDCESADDLEHALGDPNEAMLRASLELLAGRGCVADKSSQAPERLTPVEDPRRLRREGWMP